jgi:hypothetical protein
MFIRFEREEAPPQVHTSAGDKWMYTLERGANSILVYSDSMSNLQKLPVTAGRDRRDIEI